MPYETDNQYKPSALFDFFVDGEANHTASAKLFEAAHKTTSLTIGLASARKAAQIAAENWTPEPLDLFSQRLDSVSQQCDLESYKAAGRKFSMLAQKRLALTGSQLLEHYHENPQNFLSKVKLSEYPTTWNNKIDILWTANNRSNSQIINKAREIDLLQSVVKSVNKPMDETYLVHHGLNLCKLDKLKLNASLATDQALMAGTESAELAGRKLLHNISRSDPWENKLPQSGLAQFGAAVFVNTVMDKTLFYDKQSSATTMLADALSPLAMVMKASPKVKLATMIFAHAAAKIAAPRKD